MKRETWKLRLMAHRYGRKIRKNAGGSTFASTSIGKRILGNSGANSTSEKDSENTPVATTTEKIIDQHLVQHVVAVKMFSRTFPTSNVWILHDGNEAALIDSGYGDAPSIDARREYFGKNWADTKFVRIAMTHHHFDHSSGGRQLRDMLRADTAIHPLDEALLHTPLGPAEGNEDLPDDKVITDRAEVWKKEAFETPIDVTMADGEQFKVGSLTVTAVHTPGHTAGHNCYYVEETGQLFTGDNILGVGTSAIGPPPSGNMGNYLDSLRRMQELQAKLFAPGHGPVVTATAAKVQELLDHREIRDRQIIDIVEKGYDTDQRIRRALYPEIQKGLRRAAHGQVRSHVARMVGQGIMEVDESEDGSIWTVRLTK
ncbi:MAG: MBL fold metallo-hydrolase [Dehalococcoidia bacterium]|nr:MBL fold metallo-hydrolase [Dehalococcoidia bacterium]